MFDNVQQPLQPLYKVRLKVHKYGTDLFHIESDTKYHTWCNDVQWCYVYLLSNVFWTFKKYFQKMDDNVNLEAHRVNYTFKLLYSFHISK